MYKRLLSPRLIIALLSSLLSLHAQAQSGCPEVAASGSTSICPGSCTTLSAHVQATLGTNAYTVAALPYTPYSFSAGTTVLLGIDDWYTALVPIPFNFCFYGATYNQLAIGANGDITFNPAMANTTDPWTQTTGPIPNASYPSHIMCPYHDIDPSVGNSTIKWAIYGTAPCRQFVISWNQVPLFNCNTEMATQQVVLNETTNYIDIYIQDKPLCSSWNSGAAILGIQNTTYTAATTVPGRNGTQWTASNEGWRFAPAGPASYTFNWYQGTTSLGSATSLSVCPVITTTYTAQLVNTACDGTRITLNSYATVTVGSGSAISASTSASSVCGGGSAVLTASGSSAYTWSPAATLSASTGASVTAHPLTTTTYTVTGAGSSGCSNTATVTVNAGTAPALSILANNPSCHSGSGNATVSVSGGTPPYAYSWSAPGISGPSAAGLAPGTYSVQVSSSGGCVSSSTFSITSPPAIQAQIQTTQARCSSSCDGSISIHASGGTGILSYSWSPNTGNAALASGLCSGQYTCTIRDANGCIFLATDSIRQVAALQVRVAGIPASCSGACNGQVICIPAGGSGPYAYSWNTGCTAASCSGLCSGSYSVTITDAHGCIRSNTAQVSSPAPMLIHNYTSHADCGQSNGKDSAAVSGGASPYTYSWTSGAASGNTCSQLAPGTYMVSIRDANNCTASDTFHVPNAAGLKTVVARTKNVSCYGGSDGLALIKASQGTPPYTYQWSPSISWADSAAALQAGVYTCTVTDSKGCRDAATVNISEAPLLKLNTSNPPAICIGSQASLHAQVSGGTPGYIYTWLDAGGQAVSLPASPAQTTTYTVSCSDSNKCISSPLLVTVQVKAPIRIQDMGNPNICPGSSALLQIIASGGDTQYNYSWSPATGLSMTNASNTVANPTSTTLYTVSVRDGCGSPVDTAHVLITVNPLPQIVLSAQDTAGCSPLNTHFSMPSTLSGSTITWKFGDSTQSSGINSPVHTYTNSSTQTQHYSISIWVKDNHGCSASLHKTDYITVYPLPLASFQSMGSASITSPDVSFINTSSGANSWSWDFGDGSGQTSTLQNPVHAFPDTGCYTVTLTATNTFGCIASSTEPVCIQPDFTFYAPDAFTPNDDGLNDTWKPKGVGVDIREYSMIVFDRWGNQVFSTTSWQEGWDGRANGGAEVAQLETYVWVAQIKDFKGKKHRLSGKITILK
jgi:gliding motility-associated-like protein